MHHPTTFILAALLAGSAPLVAADDHAGHDHAAHGKAEAVGTATFGAQQVAVSAVGIPKAGGTWHLELLFKPAAPAPKAVRVWVGAENGRGSAKAKAEPEKDAAGAYVFQVEIPATLAADAQVWISVEPETGEAVKAAVALPKAK